MAPSLLCRNCQSRLLQLPRQALSSQARVLSSASSLTASHSRALPAASRPNRCQRRSLSHTARRSSIIGNVVNTISPKAGQTYMLYAATKDVYNACAAQAAYEINQKERKDGSLRHTEDGEEIGTGDSMWHKDFDLLPTFSTWAQVTMLHLWLLLVRIRCLDADDYRMWERQLTDHFFHGAEDRMETTHGLTSRAIRQRYLKDLFLQWRGVILAYDEGLVKGDAVLASAVWRNLFKAREDIDVRKLAAVVAWMRLVLKNLDSMLDPALAFHAASVFKWPATSELRLVDEPAEGMNEALPEEAEAKEEVKAQSSSEADSHLGFRANAGAQSTPA